MNCESLPGYVLALAEEYGLAFTETPETATAEQAERECDLLLMALKEALDEQEGNVRAYRAELDRAKRWLERTNRGAVEKEAWIRHMLEVVAPYLPRYGEKKSRDLPHGVVGWRTNPERLTVDDPAAAIAFAKSIGIPTEGKETVKHAALELVWRERRASDRNFVPPGCRVIEAEERFHAEAKDVG